ncbi:MAG: ADOP family duplicated permease [Acidobacteriota bacterium]
MYSRRRRYEELGESMREHLAERVDELVEQGVPREEAEYRARREFGNVTHIEEQARAVWQWPRVESLWADVKYALRQMRRSKGFAAAAVGTLALGIGAAAAMFTVVDHVLLQPLPYKDPGRLVTMDEHGPDSRFQSSTPWVDFVQWRAASRSFEDMAFGSGMMGRSYIQGNSASLQVGGQEVSENLFALLGVKPAMGPGFVAEQPAMGAAKNHGSIVLSHSVWESAFAGDKNIVGRVVRVNDEPYTVVGVMPAGFAYPLGGAPFGQVWTTIELGKKDQGRDWESSYYDAIGRLRPGVTVAAAQAEMTTIQKQVAAQYKDSEIRESRSLVGVKRYDDSLIDKDVKKALLALLAAAGVLWLIASVNVTNLLLARATARQREIAMRGALGASRARLVQQMLVEGLLLSAGAAALGIGLALLAVKVTGSVAPVRLNVNFSTQVDWRILAALCGLTLLTAVLASAWPALMAAKAPIEPALKQGGQQTGAGRRHNRLRSGLVAVEVAMSLTLLVACGLLLRTIYTLRHVPLGYRTDHIIVANLAIPSYRFTDKSVEADLYQPLLQRTQQLHGVDAAGLISEVPLGQTFNIMLSLRMNGNTITAGLKTVSPDIQKIFGMKMLAGRFFTSGDTPTSQGVAVVNPAFAREYAPNKHDWNSLLGMKVWNLRKDMPARIVGVLEDERQTAVAKPSQPEVEVCLCQITPASGIYQPSTIAMDLAVRTRRPAAEMIPELRDLLKQASPELANSKFSTMDQIVEDSFGSQRLAAHLLEVFGGSALLLCVAGLYGLLAYVVSQRTRELGLRIALGAQRGNLLWLVLRQAGAMLLTGVAVGLGLAWVSGRLVRGFLYGVQAHDAWTLAGAALVLFASGMLAAYLPARRAAGVNPMEALRSE